MQILSELGRVPQWDARDKSYNFDRNLTVGTMHLGFVVRDDRMSFEIWFTLETPQGEIGSNYAVIAHESAKLAGKTVPNPPYPRPEFHSQDELRLILADCFGLSDILTDVIERCAGPTDVL